MLTRFAPSPTGLMHLGNIRIALICYLYARKNQGKFVLRIDDTNTVSCQDKYQDYIKQDLEWLGLEWDLLVQQSERFERYNQVFNELRKIGRIYECYETAEELEIKRKLLISNGMPPVYNHTTLNDIPEQIKKYQEQGRRPHFRFKINIEETISWYDKIREEITFIGSNLSDPVVMRTNGLYTYMLPSVIDDMDYGITNVIRGEDHITNTAVQIQMMEALKSKIPYFAHLSLLNIAGNKLSKRENAIDIRSFKQQGIEAMTINNYLANIGSSSVITHYTNLSHLIKEFDIQKFSCSAISIELKDINILNEKIIRNTPFTDVFSRIKINDLTEEFWQAIKFNIKTIDEVKDWWRICKTNIQPIITDKAFIKLAYESLPKKEWDETTWDKWITILKDVSGRRGKDLFMPLRLALTAAEQGPELAKLLPMIDKDLVKSRLTQSGVTQD